MTPTGKPPADVEIGGALLIWMDGGVWMGQFTGDDTHYVPVFSSLDHLLIFCVMLELHGFDVKQVDDGPDFLSSLWESGVGCVLDPVFIGQGKWRFHLVTTAAALQPPS